MSPDDSQPFLTTLAQIDMVCDEFEASEDSAIEDYIERVISSQQNRLFRELLAIEVQRIQSSGKQKTPWADYRRRFPQYLEEIYLVEATNKKSDRDDPGWTAVASCRTFDSLSFEAKCALASAFTTADYKSGDLLLQEGQSCRGLHLLTSGVVEVVNVTNQNQIIDTDSRGSVLGEISLLTGKPCSASVIAKGDTTALVLPPDRYRLIQQKHPEIEICLSQLTSDRLGSHKVDALCGKRVGEFQLEECISAGGMGVVYRGTRVSNGATQALKMLRHRFIYDSAVLSRFEQEADLLRKLEHPNIVKFHDHFVEYRTRFIVMEFCDGSDLRQIINNEGKLQEPAVRQLVGQIAIGLRHAHRLGIMHLDLKPENILVDHEGRVLLADFGLSQLIEADGSTRELAGTPLYMAPEQFLREPLAPGTDWYALGCIVYELLAGKTLFNKRSQNLYQDKQQKLADDWPALSISEELRDVMRLALQPVAEDRQLDIDQICQWATNTRNSDFAEGDSAANG